MCKQILPTSTMRDIWRTVRRIRMLIFELKGLKCMSLFTCRLLESSTLFPTRTINGFFKRPNLSFCPNSTQSGTLCKEQQFVTSKQTKIT